MDRAAVRATMLARRAALSEPERSGAGRAFAQLCEPLLRGSARVAVYRAMRGEIDPLPLARHELARGTRLYLPVTGPDRSLAFARWREGDPLARSLFGIDEPRPAAARLDPRRLDVVIVPVVAFDRDGVRIGHGAGYYDRAFAFRLRPRTRRPLLVGAAYAFQECDTLTAEPWDVPLDLIVTEREVITARRRRRTPPTRR